MNFVDRLLVKGAHGSASNTITYLDIPKSRLSAAVIHRLDTTEDSDQMEIATDGNNEESKQFLVPGYPRLQSDRLIIDERSLSVDPEIIRRVNQILAEKGGLLLLKYRLGTATM